MSKLKPWTLHNKMIVSTIIKSTKLKQHVSCRFDKDNYFLQHEHDMLDDINFNYYQTRSQCRVDNNQKLRAMFN